VLPLTWQALHDSLARQGRTFRIAHSLGGALCQALRLLPATLDNNQYCQEGEDHKQQFDTLVERLGCSVELFRTGCAKPECLGSDGPTLRLGIVGRRVVGSVDVLEKPDARALLEGAPDVFPFVSKDLEEWLKGCRHKRSCEHEAAASPSGVSPSTPLADISTPSSSAGIAPAGETLADASGLEAEVGSKEGSSAPAAERSEPVDPSRPRDEELLRRIDRIRTICERHWGAEIPAALTADGCKASTAKSANDSCDINRMLVRELQRRLENEEEKGTDLFQSSYSHFESYSSESDSGPDSSSSDQEGSKITRHIDDVEEVANSLVMRKVDRETEPQQQAGKARAAKVERSFNAGWNEMAARGNGGVVWLQGRDVEHLEAKHGVGVALVKDSVKVEGRRYIGSEWVEVASEWVDIKVAGDNIVSVQSCIQEITNLKNLWKETATYRHIGKQARAKCTKTIQVAQSAVGLRIDARGQMQRKRSFKTVIKSIQAKGNVNFNIKQESANSDAQGIEITGRVKDVASAIEDVEKAATQLTEHTASASCARKAGLRRPSVGDSVIVGSSPVHCRTGVIAGEAWIGRGPYQILGVGDPNRWWPESDVKLVPHLS